MTVCWLTLKLNTVIRIAGATKRRLFLELRRNGLLAWNKKACVMPPCKPLTKCNGYQVGVKRVLCRWLIIVLIGVFRVNVIGVCRLPCLCIKSQVSCILKPSSSSKKWLCKLSKQALMRGGILTQPNYWVMMPQIILK